MGGGPQNFGVFPKKKTVFFFASPNKHNNSNKRNNSNYKINSNMFDNDGWWTKLLWCELERNNTNSNNNNNNNNSKNNNSCLCIKCTKLIQHLLICCFILIKTFI